MFEMIFVSRNAFHKPTLNKQKDSISSKLFKKKLFTSLRFMILLFLISQVPRRFLSFPGPRRPRCRCHFPVVYWGLGRDVTRENSSRALLRRFYSVNLYNEIDTGTIKKNEKGKAEINQKEIV